MDTFFSFGGSFFYLPVDMEYKPVQKTGAAFQQGGSAAPSFQRGSDNPGSYDGASRGFLDILSNFAQSVGKLHVLIYKSSQV